YGHGEAEADPATGPSRLEEPDRPDLDGFALRATEHASFLGNRFAILCRGRRARSARALSSLPPHWQETASSAVQIYVWWCALMSSRTGARCTLHSSKVADKVGGRISIHRHT